MNNVNAVQEKWSLVKRTMYTRYYISNHGRVKAVKATGERILKSHLVKRKGRAIGHVYGNGTSNVYLLIHREVAKEFIPNPNDYKFVLHVDGDKNNNHVDNLIWSPVTHDTAIDNLNH